MGVRGVLPPTKRGDQNNFDHMKTKNVILSSILNVLFPVILLQHTTFYRIGNMYLIRGVVKGVELKRLFYVKYKFN